MNNLTLEEAIAHAEEVADYDCYNDEQRRCADEHRQLAEWLRELKRFREMQTDGDSISRIAAMTMPVLPKEHRDYISFELDDIYEQGWNECQRFIAKLPSTDRPRGEWIETDRTYFGATVFKCSVCCDEIDEMPTVMGVPKYKYCPYCGIKMKGADDEKPVQGM